MRNISWKGIEFIESCRSKHATSSRERLIYDHHMHKYHDSGHLAPSRLDETNPNSFVFFHVIHIHLWSFDSTNGDQWALCCPTLRICLLFSEGRLNVDGTKRNISPSSPSHIWED